MASGPTEIMAAIAAGLATVTNLSTARVYRCATGRCRISLTAC